MPTNPVLAATVKNVPPTPTFNPVSPTSNPFPTVKIPTVLLNTKSDDVEKSSRYVPTPALAFGSKILSLNKTLPLFPGGVTVTVAATPKLTALAVMAIPTKFICVILLSVPTNVPSSKTDNEPGIIPPPIGTQYLSPGFDKTDTT